MRRHGIACDHLGIGFGCLVRIHRAQALANRAVQVGDDGDTVCLAGVGVADADQHLVALGVKRIGVCNRFKAGKGGNVVFAAPVVAADFEFALGQDLLHFTQALLGARNQRGIGKHVDHLPVFLLGLFGVDGIAVGLFHLLVVDVGDLHLGFGSLGGIGEEGNEVLILGFGLGESGGASLFEPGVTDRELGAHAEFRLGVGIEQSLKVEPGHVIAALLHGDHRLVVEFLVRLLRLHTGERIGIQVVCLLRLLFLDVGGIGGGAAEQQCDECDDEDFREEAVHTTSMIWRAGRLLRRMLTDLAEFYSFRAISRSVRRLWRLCGPRKAGRAYRAPAARPRTQHCRQPGAPHQL